ncbi:hypothetical protein [Aldersonia kunmingensis]|uniref:hypothetical protein n=1 Tax=Aldersonia kunmingensis TaxID=408066 RepID=UPI0012ED4E87|nr:hypothetical protein [Aldersonia kunmingensis]
MVTGFQRVVGQNGRVYFWRALIRGDEPPMQTGLGAGRHGTTDCQPVQVVPERKPARRSLDQPGIRQGAQRPAHRSRGR